MRMNENGNAKCSLLLFVAISKTKTDKCLLLLVMAFVARFGFLWMFPFELVLAFCWYEKPKRATKGKKSPNGNQALFKNLVKIRQRFLVIN